MLSCMSGEVTVSRIGVPDTALVGAELELRMEIHNGTDQIWRLHLVLDDEDTGERIHDYGIWRVDPGSYLNPFPGVWPVVETHTMPGQDWNLVGKVFIVGRMFPEDTLSKTIGKVPVLFQYQVVFEDPCAELVDLLQKQYDLYMAADRWLVTPVNPDCFAQLEPMIDRRSGGRETGWLCQAVEYGKSPCAPLPYWLCPLPASETIYFRGECSCAYFQEVLQPLGIPCQHLIAAKMWYGSTVPYCPYIQCP